MANRGYVLEVGSVTLADSSANLIASPVVQAAYLGGGG